MYFQIEESLNDSSEPTNVQEPDRPILEEVAGTWQLIAQENIAEFCRINSFGIEILKGINLLLTFKDHDSSMEIIEHSTSAVSEGIAVVVPTTPCPTERELDQHYLEDNQWFITSKDSAEWNMIKIENGLLRVQFNQGCAFFTNIYERI